SPSSPEQLQTAVDGVEQLLTEQGNMNDQQQNTGTAQPQEGVQGYNQQLTRHANFSAGSFTSGLQQLNPGAPDPILLVNMDDNNLMGTSIEH
ncbi:unnamed protein product, partial [Amoebophrya sp. A120]